MSAMFYWFSRQGWWVCPKALGDLASRWVTWQVGYMAGYILRGWANQPHVLTQFLHVHRGQLTYKAPLGLMLCGV